MAQSNSLPEELLPLLIARIRVGTALVATSIVLYGALELWLQRAPLGSFFAVKAVQVAAVAIVWIALARIRNDGWRVAVGLALALVVEVCVTLVVSGILAGDVASAPLLFILVTLGTATLLPWGLWPQAATVAIAARLVAGERLARPRARRLRLPGDRRRDDVRRRRSSSPTSSRCTAGSAIAPSARSAPARARSARRSSSPRRRRTRARELLAGCDTRRCSRRSAGSSAGCLHCDASYTFARDPHDTTAFVAVATDGDGETEWASRRALRIPDIGLARMLDRLDRDEPVVLQDAPGMLPVDGRAGVYTALFAGRDVIGIQVAVRRQPEPLHPDRDRARAPPRPHRVGGARAGAASSRTPDASGTPRRASGASCRRR